MGRSNIQRKVGNKAGQFRKQARAVQAFHLDDCELVGERVVDLDTRLHLESLGGLLRLGTLGQNVGQMRLAGQDVLNDLADAFGTAALVVVGIEFTADENGIERPPVAGGENLRVDDVGPCRRAGARYDRQEAGMVGRQHRDFGHGLEGVWLRHGGQRPLVAVGFADEMGVPDLILEADGQEIVGVVEGQIGIALVLGPVGKPFCQRLSRLIVTVGAGQFRKPPVRTSSVS